MKFGSSINGNHLTTGERDSLSPVEGDIIYNTSVDKYQFFDGVIWKDFGTGNGGGTEVIITSIVNPTVNDDANAGYFVGQRWVNTVTLRAYIATDVSIGSAVWKEITPPGGIETGDQGEITLGSGVVLGTALTATINANTDNLVVPNIETAIVLRLNVTGNYSLTGLTPANITKAWMLFVANIGTGNLSIKNNDPASLAENRFILGSNKTIQSDEGILLFYDPISNRWRGSGILI